MAVRHPSHSYFVWWSRWMVIRPRALQQILLNIRRREGLEVYFIWISFMVAILLQWYYISITYSESAMNENTESIAYEEHWSTQWLQQLRNRKYKKCRQFSTLAQMLQVYSSGNGTTNAQSYPPKEVVVAGSAEFCFDDIATPNDRSQG